MGSTGTKIDSRTQHPDVGKQVTIRSRGSWMNGEWGVVKMVDGDTYYVAPYNSDTEALVFSKKELKFSKTAQDVVNDVLKLTKAEPVNSFYTMMRVVNKLKSEGVTELNKQDTAYLLMRDTNDQLRNELEYLGCRVTKVADLFNVKLPDKKFTREELERAKRIETLY